MRRPCQRRPTRRRSAPSMERRALRTLDARSTHPRAVRAHVELVVDLSDDLLDHVLQRHDPDLCSVVARDEGEVLLAVPELTKNAPERRRMVERERLEDRVAQPELPRAQLLEE